MRSYLGAFLLLLVAVPASVLGQKSVADALASFPDCAQTCVVEGLQTKICSPSDQTCICTNEEFQQGVTACVMTSCTAVYDRLLAKNATLTNCGAPVRDRSQKLVIVSNTMAVISALFVIIRFGYKIFVIKTDMGLDDWIILVAIISAVPSAYITANCTTVNGLGKDIWTLAPEQITNAIMYFYVLAVMYFAQTALVKLSITAFYMRIFPSRSTQRLLWGTFVLTVLWGFTYVITAIFQCTPVKYFWTQWDGVHEGHCLDANGIAWSNAAINIALDLWALAIPLWELRSLQLHWKKKVGVALMFCVGTFVTVVSILRLQSLVAFGSKSNRTWDFWNVSLWSTVEICVGIICACLPTVRLVLVKIFPMLAGSTHRLTGSYYQRYGTGGRSGTAGARGVHTANTIVTVDRPASTIDSEAHAGGIVFHKSYNVQYSDNDESSLVPMSDLSKSDDRR